MQIFKKKEKIKRKSWKGLVSFIMAVIIASYTLIADWSLPERLEAAGANDRVTTFIQLAQGRSIIDADGEMLANLTQDELQFLGVYLSNFYIPFATELGATGDLDNTKEQMSQALQKNMKWSEEMSDLLCEEIIGLSRSNDKELHLYGSVYYHDGSYTEIGGIQNNYFNFIRFMLGASSQIKEGYYGEGNYIEGDKYDSLSDEEKLDYQLEYAAGGFRIYAKPKAVNDKGLQEFLNGKYNYVYWGYPSDSGDINIVYDASLSGRYITASQTVFREILSGLDLNKGYGLSFFDLTSEEIEVTDLGNINASGEELLNLSIYGDKMYVDCFGNIIKKGKIHQYIAIPSCMNPYTWVSVDEDGNDILQAGTAYNVVNFNSMSMADEDNLLVHGYWDDWKTYIWDKDNTKDTVIERIKNLSCYSRLVSLPEVEVGIALKGDDFLVSPFCMEILRTYKALDITAVFSNNSEPSPITIQEIAEYEACVSGLTAEMNISGVSEVTGYGNSIHLTAPPEITNESIGDINQSVSIQNGFEYLKGEEGVGRTGLALRLIRGDNTWSLTKDSWFFAKQKNFSFATAVQQVNDVYKKVYPDDYSYYAAKYGGIDTSASITLGDSISEINPFDDSGDYDEKRDKMVLSSAIFIFDNYGNVCKLQKEDATSGVLTYSTQDGRKNFYENRLFYMDNMIVIDNIGAFNADNGGKADFSTINFMHYLDEKGDSPIKLLESYAKDPYNGYNNVLSDITAGKMKTEINVSEAATSSVYVTYLIAGLYENSTESKKETIGKLGFRINKEGLPKISNAAISMPDSMKVDVVEDAIRDWTYYLLHPTKGLNYVKTLVKNKTQAILVGWHNDMVGTNGVGAITGTTTYRSTIGYVTTPDLSEIEWTSQLLSFYNKAIPYLILAMFIIMLFSYIAGIMPLQKAIFGLLVFSIFLYLPATAINSVVGISNRVIQRIYGDRFTYWALVQEETYISAIDSAASNDSYENYLRTLYAINNETYSNQGGDSIVLKWQAPKKMASLMLTKEDHKILNNLQSSKLVSWALNRDTMSGQTYLDGDYNYMFRSYTDLSNVSRYMYNGINIGNVTVDNSKIAASEDFKEHYMAYQSVFANDIAMGYTNLNRNSSTNLSDNWRICAPISSDIYYDATTTNIATIDRLNYETAPGINQGYFNFSLPIFNNNNVNYETIFSTEVAQNNTSMLIKSAKHYGLGEGNPSKKLDKEMTGLAAYGLMSENPYYYFSWCLYDQGMNSQAGASGGYKNLLLSQSNGGYFYNTKGNGELKDFMDMRSMFTIVIPYLKQGNDVVREFDDLYGIFLYDGVPTEEGHWEDVGMTNQDGTKTELYKKYWHNVSVARLYEIYTPWVDLMYDCDYAKPTTITVMGKDYTVSDPLNPASYPAERPMIFSASEMYDYGLTEADLTEVERRILKTNEGMSERMFELLNYVNFSDATLNTAAAMECAFEFNINFSQDKVIGENINIYPQSFEINNFSYDAFLRLILSNTTNESLTGSGDFYMTVVQKSSTTTAILLIVNDIVSQYVFPGFKIFFIACIFIACILLIVVTAFKVDPQQKFIKKLIGGIALPMGGFLLTNIVFAWVISMFMGVGNNAVTQTKITTIQMGDPVIAMLLMIALDLLCMMVYYKIIRAVIQEIKANTNLIKSYVGGVMSGTLAVAGGAVSGGLSGMSAARGQNGGTFSNVSEEGTGRMSASAARRASHNNAEGMQEEPNTRINDAKRDTFKQSKVDEKKFNRERSEKEINEKINKGSHKMESNAEDYAREDINTRRRSRNDNKAIHSSNNKEGFNQ